MTPVLLLYRRHKRDCRYATRGRRENNRCSCAWWADGTLDGERFNKSLKTSDRSVAQARLHAFEIGDIPLDKDLAEAAQDWQRQLEVATGTRRKYKRAIATFVQHMQAKSMPALQLEDLDSWRDSRRAVSVGTFIRELQAVRLFFDFALERRWVRTNLARRIKTPKAKQRQVLPFSPDEMQKIIAASKAIGRGGYERSRARALVLLLANTGLRLGDAMTLAHSRVVNGQLRLRTQKTNQTVWLPLPADLTAALEALPLPWDQNSTPIDSGYYFWNGQSTTDSVLYRGERILRTVFKKAGILNGHAHRFRHTLAVSILASGRTLQDVAAILGNSPGIVEKYYSSWSKERQDRITEVMEEMHNNLRHPRYTDPKGAQTKWKN
jgi:site-specific recombinase XerD